FAVTGLENETVHLHEGRHPGELFSQIGRIWKLADVFPHEKLVEDHAEAVDIPGDAALAVRRHINGGAWRGSRLALVSDQSHVGQFRLTFHKNDIGRLDVPVNKSLSVEVSQSGRQRKAD